MTKSIRTTKARPGEFRSRRTCIPSRTIVQPTLADSIPEKTIHAVIADVATEDEIGRVYLAALTDYWLRDRLVWARTSNLGNKKCND